MADLPSHLLKVGVWTANDVRFFEQEWTRNLYPSGYNLPVVLPGDAEFIDLGPKLSPRCRYCKSIVFGDKCKTCGAPQ